MEVNKQRAQEVNIRGKKGYREDFASERREDEESEKLDAVAF